MDHLLSKEKECTVKMLEREKFLSSFERSKDFSKLIFENRTTKKDNRRSNNV